MGLREIKKARRNKRILEAAEKLFRKSGYSDVRIEDIAEIAEVSVGTFYNYFKSKGEVLVAIVTMEVEEVLATGEQIVKAPPSSATTALNALIAQYFDHSLVYLSKEMWRTAMALAIQHPETHLGKHYTQLDRRLCAQVCALVEALQDRDLVATNIDSTSIGELIFNNFNMMFIEFAKCESMTIDQLKRTVATQNAPLVKLLETNISSE